MENYYRILNVSPDVNDVEIKRAFRKLAQRYHPDKNSDKNSEEKFAKILIAYETLMDSIKRNHYDACFFSSLSISRTSTRSTWKEDEKAAFGDGYYQRKNSSHETLSETYFPYFKWSCVAGIMIALLLMVDYVSPYRITEEKILKIERIYFLQRGYEKIYDYDILFTDQGREIKLVGKDKGQFQVQQSIRVYHTFLFFSTLFISSEETIRTASLSLLYGNLSFIPFLLFIISVLGLVIRSNTDIPFSCSIVSLILLFIVLYLMII